MREVWEHPDIGSALRTGYPRGMAGENRDTEEERRAFAAEHQREFFAWLALQDAEVFDRFAGESGRRYREWLNIPDKKAVLI